MSEMKIEDWNGYKIRFVNVNDEWYAILKDICDALSLQVEKVSQRLDPDTMERVKIYVEMPSKHVHSQPFWMLAINEIGIYEVLFASRKFEARKFRSWSAGVLQKLRSKVGLEQYEVMHMMDSKIQDDIDNILGTLFFNPDNNKVMQSITIPGGDVEQRIFL